MSITDRLASKARSAAASAKSRADEARERAAKRKRGIDPDAPVYTVDAKHLPKGEYVAEELSVTKLVIAPMRDGLTTAAHEISTGTREAVSGAKRLIDHERAATRNHSDAADEADE